MAGKYDDNISVISVWINIFFYFGEKKYFHCFFLAISNMIDVIWNLKIYLGVHISIISIKINKLNSEVEKNIQRRAGISIVLIIIE